MTIIITWNIELSYYVRGPLPAQALQKRLGDTNLLLSLTAKNPFFFDFLTVFVSLKYLNN